jgi:hypothetical protein
MGQLVTRVGGARLELGQGNLYAGEKPGGELPGLGLGADERGKVHV